MTTKDEIHTTIKTALQYLEDGTDEWGDELVFSPNDFFPGFVVICQNCHGTNIILENTVGWSECSGAWGEMSVSCTDCRNKTDIWQP